MTSDFEQTHVLVLEGKNKRLGVTTWMLEKVFVAMMIYIKSPQKDNFQFTFYEEFSIILSMHTASGQGQITH